MASHADDPADDDFLNDAEAAVATVLMKLKQLKPSGMTYRLRYKFTVANEAHEHEVEISAELFNRVESGQKLNIGFLPGDPDSARILSLAE